MKSIKSIIKNLTLIAVTMCIIGCSNKMSDTKNTPIDVDVAFNYLKELDGKWVVQGGKEGIFGWEFDLTSRDGVIIERLKAGTPTEMLTVYNIDKGILRANHFCQLQNQPNLIAVHTETEGDLHFLCNAHVGNTKSHDELHMHGVHFQKTQSSLLIWMDMFKNGSKEFETRYELFRADSNKGKELLKLQN